MKKLYVIQTLPQTVHIAIPTGKIKSLFQHDSQKLTNSALVVARAKEEREEVGRGKGESNI